MSTLSLSPRWIGHLTNIIAENRKLTAFALATVDTDNPSLPIPRVRHMQHRGILTIHPSRPFLLVTTDMRSAKVHQLRSHPSTTGPTSEIAWWFPPPVVQFRIGARVHVLPESTHELYSEFPLNLLSLSSTGGGDSGPEAPETPQDWEKLRIKTFNNLPPELRASFARPAPGSPLPNPKDADEWPTKLPEMGKEETDEERELVKKALGNFALVLLEPLKVEYLELGVVPNRRTQWSFDGQTWTEQTGHTVRVQDQ